MPRPPRPCITCGTPTQGTYCHTCFPVTPRAQRNTHTWQTTRAQAKAAWLETHGAVCAGWNRPPHPTPPHQLTTDHVIPGDNTHLQCLCAPCNSAKGTKGYAKVQP